VASLTTPFGLYPFLRTLHAGDGHQGETLRSGPRAARSQANAQIARRRDQRPVNPASSTGSDEAVP
jgi:hypothetical protein